MKRPQDIAIGLLRLTRYELRRVARGIPHTACINITDRCNLRCSYCCHFRNNPEEVEDPSLDTWRERFEQLHAGGIRFVTVLGGEPTLRMDVLDLADQIFPFLDIFTNGTIRIPSRFQHRLFVSIDGPPATNDRLRGRGVTRRILDNYSGDPRAVLATALNRDNYLELEELVGWAREHGFRRISCNLYVPRRDGPDPDLLHAAERQVIVAEIRRVQSRNPDLLRMTDAMLAWLEQPDHRDACYFRDQVLHLDAAFKRKLCIGNADCANCGSLGGAAGSPLSKLVHPISSVRGLIADRFRS